MGWLVITSFFNFNYDFFGYSSLYSWRVLCEMVPVDFGFGFSFCIRLL